jgi:hypothetical protein
MCDPAVTRRNLGVVAPCQLVQQDAGLLVREAARGLQQVRRNVAGGVDLREARGAGIEGQAPIADDERGQKICPAPAQALSCYLAQARRRQKTTAIAM